MILLDYSAVAIANIARAIKMDGELLTNEFALHMIMNSIRASNVRLRRDYGEMVICCDCNGVSWRREEFELYKFKRRKKRSDSSDIDWKFVYEKLEYVKNELKNDFPYTVLQIDRAEADDIIGTLARYATENELKTVIVSNDKDFVQLHSPFVEQYRPCAEGFYNITNNLQELIIRGDSDDGVPNIKSPIDIFTVPDKRQKPIYKKELEAWKSEDDIPEELRERYIQNKRLIDLSETPTSIQQSVIEEFKRQHTHGKRPNKAKMTKFFMKNRLRYLHERMNEF